MAAQAERYNVEQIRARLETELPGWSYVDGALRREYRTDGWPTTLMLVNALGFVAEAADHHPDLVVGWGNVQVNLSTHSAGGVTAKDFELASRIDALALWRPDAESALSGVRRDFVRPGSEESR